RARGARGALAAVARLRGDAPLDGEKGRARMILATDLVTPFGDLTLASDGAALVGAYFATQRPPREVAEAPRGLDAVLERACAQLEEYFAGARRALDLPLAPRGTPFQREVWSALCAIPFGATITYA